MSNKTNNLRTISHELLRRVLKSHYLWLERNGTERGWPQGSRADLSYLDLGGANLAYAALAGADLRGANLKGAKLQRADLTNADLEGANLHGAVLWSAKLDGAKNVPDFQRCPKDGAFKAFKKVWLGSDIYILELEVAADAQRVSSTGIKCRCSKAKVICAKNLDGTLVENQENLVFQSFFASANCFNFPYRIGESVEVKDFNADIRFECAPGIHFFMEFKEAANWTC